MFSLFAGRNRPDWFAFAGHLTIILDHLYFTISATQNTYYGNVQFIVTAYPSFANLPNNDITPNTIQSNHPDCITTPGYSPGPNGVEQKIEKGKENHIIEAYIRYPGDNKKRHR